LDINRKVVFLTGDIDWDMLKNMDNVFANLINGEQDIEEVDVILTSNGGRIDVGEAIIDRLKYYSMFFNITIVGATIVGSFAVSIFLSFEKSRRVVTKGCRFYIHTYWWGLPSSGEVSLNERGRVLREALYKNQAAIRKEQLDIKKLTEITGLPRKTIEKRWENGYFFSSREAIKFGIADRYYK